MAPHNQCGARWEGSVEYREMYNGFLVFWLAAFSMTWYKKTYMYNQFFCVLQVEIVTDENPPEVIETLEKGDFYGEICLVYASPHNVSVRAVSHVDMLVLTKEDLDSVLAHYGEVAVHIKEVAERLYSNPSKAKWTAYNENYRFFLHQRESTS